MAATIAAVLNFIMWVADLCGFGKPDRVAQGEALGKAETTSTDVLGELSDVQKANTARRSVDDTASAILHDPANTGPAKQ